MGLGKVPKSSIRVYDLLPNASLPNQVRLLQVRLIPWFAQCIPPVPQVDNTPPLLFFMMIFFCIFTMNSFVEQVHSYVSFAG